MVMYTIVYKWRQDLGTDSLTTRTPRQALGTDSFTTRTPSTSTNAVYAAAPLGASSERVERKARVVLLHLRRWLMSPCCAHFATR